MAAAVTFDILARDKASATLNKVGGATEKTGKKFQKFGVFAATAGAAAGVALLKFGKDSVTAFTQAEDASVRLQDAFARFPKIADSNVGSITAIADALQKKTKADDESIKSGAAVLAQFVSSGKQLEQLLPLTVDYARKTGKDVPSAAKTLGKAFLGNTRALKELGINYKMTGDKSKDMANITELLQKKVGGFAEKEGKTAAGQAAILGNQFGELQEKVGAKLVPALVKLADVGLKVVDFISRNASVIMPLVAALAVVVGAIKAWTVAQAALNVVMALNPIGLVVIAIAGLVAALVIAYKKSETFRNIVNGAFNAVKTVAMAVFNWIRDHWKLLLVILTGPIGAATVLIISNWEKLKNAASSVYNWVKDKFGKIVTFIRSMPGKISNAASGMWDGIKNAFKSAINGIIGAWNRLGIPGFSVNINIPGPVPDVHFSWSGLSLPDIPYLAQGGIVKARRGGVLAILGEAGQDEAVVPLRRGNGQELSVPSANGGGNITITGDVHFHGVQNVREMVEQIQRYSRRNAGVKVRTFA